MKEPVAIEKDVDAKKDFSPTRSDKNVYRVRNEPEKQLGSLKGVIHNIRHGGGKPSVESIATQLSGMPTGGRAPALLALQQTHGNRYVQRVVSGIQAKLMVGQPGDKYEQEADRVADAVMRMPEPPMQRQMIEEEEELVQPKLKTTPEHRIQRQEGEEEILLTKKREDTTPEVTHDLESRIHALRGGGQPLPEHLSAYFEPRFGYDFSQVRVHTGAKAAESALGGGVIHRESDAEAERVRKLNEDYEQVFARSNWPAAAELLNGFNREDILARLKKIGRGRSAAIHAGAIENPKVGPDSQVAELSRPYYLDMNFVNEMRRGQWAEAAKYLNGFNDADILERVRKMSDADRQHLQQGVAQYDPITKAIDATNKQPAQGQDQAQQAQGPEQEQSGGRWTPPSGDKYPIEAIDPREFKASKNPLAPDGWKYWPDGKKIKPAHKTLANRCYDKDTKIGTFIQDMHDGELFGVRIEWHTSTKLYSNETEKWYNKKGRYKGGSLMVPKKAGGDAAKDAGAKEAGEAKTLAPAISELKRPNGIAVGPAGGGVIHRESDAEAERVRKLNEDYEQVFARSNWPAAAELLNGFNREDILARLKKIGRGRSAAIHAGAIENPKVGPDSQVAELSRPYYLDMNFVNEMRRGQWAEAAKYLNGFNDADILERVRKMSDADRQHLQQGVAQYDPITKAIDATNKQPAQGQDQAQQTPTPAMSELKRPNGLAEIIAVFGKPGTNLGMHEMRCGKDGAKKKVYCHNKIAPLLISVFENIYNAGDSKHIHFFDGCYNDRNKRGSDKRSVHAWGIAVDINPEGNDLVPSDTPADEVPVSDSQTVLAPYFKAAGFVWGRAFGDSMHFQYCTGY